MLSPDRNSPHAASIATDHLSIGGGGRSRPVLPGPLVDGQRRAVRYLRLSLTDRCNFRCRYCMPADGVRYVPRGEILSFDEITRLVRSFVSLGISRIRLTGGEPMLRRDVLDLVERIAAVDGVEDLSMSTNGFLLAPLARRLASAGLKRVNISIDTLRPDRFAHLTRVGSLDRVLKGIDAAVEAGLAPVKLNAVVIRGYNDDELADLVEFAAARGALLRLIEFMPIGVDGFWSDDTFVSTQEMMAKLSETHEIIGSGGFAGDEGVVGGGPARYHRVVPRGRSAEPHRVGFISALSHNFCGSCNRVRVTATGGLQECLAYPGELSLRDAIRAGATERELTSLIEAALFGKRAGHLFDPLGGGQRTYQSMSVTGG